MKLFHGYFIFWKKNENLVHKFTRISNKRNFCIVSLHENDIIKIKIRLKLIFVMLKVVADFLRSSIFFFIILLTFSSPPFSHAQLWLPTWFAMPFLLLVKFHEQKSGFSKNSKSTGIFRFIKNTNKILNKYSHHIKASYYVLWDWSKFF